jgi:predicted DNA-binding protein with PD1-like motif
MKAMQDTDGRWVLSLHPGESIREEIEGLALREGIQGATLSGIGAIHDPEIGHYDLANKTYRQRGFPGLWELITIQGNVSMLEGKPFMHAHVTFAGSDYHVRGGHLFDATIAVVGEIFLNPISVPLPRIHCAAIGLARLEPLQLTDAT